jgi:hypothetical protein
LLSGLKNEKPFIYKNRSRLIGYGLPQVLSIGFVIFLQANGFSAPAPGLTSVQQLKTVFTEIQMLFTHE